MVNATTESDKWIFTADHFKDYIGLFKKFMCINPSFIKRVAVCQKVKNVGFFGIHDIILERPCFRRELLGFLDRQRCQLFMVGTEDPLSYYFHVFDLNNSLVTVFHS